MIKTSSWIRRTFSFDFPVELFPSVAERLRGTPARLDEFVKTAAIESLTRAQDISAWTIQEHIGHLYDLEEMHDARLDDFLAGKPELRSADLRNKKTKQANHNNSSIESILTKFRTARMNMVNRVESLTIEALAISATHPRLSQPMRLVDMIFFVAEHDDHHLSLMREISREINK